MSFWKSLTSKIFFDKEDYTILALVDKVKSVEKYRHSLSALMDSSFHPNGISLLASRREVRYANAVIQLLTRLDAGQSSDRLEALAFLHSEVINNSGIGHRYNTGRVLIQIMKELVRSSGSVVKKLKLAHDFRRSASGRIGVIRKMLRRYNLLEMPECYNQLSFDNHVHDASTKGRKTPTHLILDAWIKGIKSITVIYYNQVNIEAVEELLAAADIMDIRVRIGIEYKTISDGKHVDLIWGTSFFSNLFLSPVKLTPRINHPSQ